MKGGAFDYLVKPVDLERLSQLLERAFEAARLMHVPAVLPAEESGDRIVGRSPVMQEMCKAIGRMAPQDVNVLILGESGTGKELVARALYHHSRRADRPFLAINCAAIPETLLESELFGHEQGAFTGAAAAPDRQVRAVRRRHALPRRDRRHDGPPCRPRCCASCRSSASSGWAATRPMQTNVRVLAATNHDLEEAVAEGRFRKDLYYRLKVVTIQVPPLRARLDDVAELAHYFLFRFDRELGLDLRGFAPETLELLQSYSWPGNVRELQSVIKQAMLHASGHVLLPEFLPAELQGGSLPPSPPASPTGPRFDLETLIEALLQRGATDVYQTVSGEVERILLPRVLAHTQGHLGHASEVLGLNRSTLRTKLRALGLTVDKVVAAEPSEEGMRDEG